MLWIEIGAGVEPLLYMAKRRRYLIPQKYLVKCYRFRCKAHALLMLKKHPDRYEFSKLIQITLRETETIPRVHHVERRKIRRHMHNLIKSVSITKGEVEDDDRDEESHSPQCLACEGV